jgi:ATP-dependent protease ClpP protease subunit
MIGKWYSIADQQESLEAEVSIYDEIGGWGVSAQSFLTEISGLKGKRINLRLNSPGGSVIDGNAIYNALRRHVGGVTVYIDGLAASMASVVAMAGERVIMADNALMMIHNPWTVAVGNSDDLRKDADLLDKLKSGIRRAYAGATGMSEDEIQSMMDAETWLDPVQAVSLGFADEITPGLKAAANHRMQFDNYRKKMEPNETNEPVADSTIVEPVVTETTPAETVEPTASVNMAAILDKVSTLTDALAKSEARCAIFEADAKHNAQLCKLLEEALGVLPARVVAETKPTETPTQTILERWNAITDATERERFYRQHREEILASAK